MVVASNPTVVSIPLHPYQQDALDKILNLRGRAGLFLDMGTGKTRTALAAVEALGCRKVLVVCPISAVGAWKQEVVKLGLQTKVTDLTHGSIKDRASYLRDVRHNGEGSFSEHEMVLVNYEAYWREPLRSAIVRFKPQMVIYDEAHRLKGRSTRQSRFAHSLQAPHNLALTGTPIANGLEDIYSIFKAFRPEVFGSRWQPFSDRYLTMGGYLGHQIVGYRNQDELENKMASVSYRKRKEEILDLPDKVDVRVPVPLDDRSYYNEMVRHAVAQITGRETAPSEVGIDEKSGRLISGVALSRVMLTNILRLQQLASGFVTLSDGRVVDTSYEKDLYLKDLLQDAAAADNKIVVFCRFRREVDRAYSVAQSFLCSDILDGRVATQRRESVIHGFQYGRTQCLVVQIAAGALGINLSSAHIAIFYGLDYNLGTYLQARDRLHRIGQKNNVTYYHLLAERTVDEKIFRILEHKENLAETVLRNVEAAAQFLKE